MYILNFTNIMFGYYGITSRIFLIYDVLDLAIQSILNCE